MALTQIKLGGLAAESVDSDAYVDGSIDLAHLSADSVDSTQYVDASIDNAHLADDAADSDEIAAGAIDLAHMSVNSIDSDQYVDGSIDAAHLASGVGGSWVKLVTETVSSAVAEVDIETGIGGTYKNYVLHVSSIAGATNGQDLRLELKIGGSYRTASGGYSYRVLTHGSAGSGFNDNLSDGDDLIKYVMAGLGNGANSTGDFTMWFSETEDTSKNKQVHWHGVYTNNNDNVSTVTGAGGYQDYQTALTGLRFKMGSGNIARGVFTLYGLT